MVIFNSFLYVYQRVTRSFCDGELWFVMAMISSPVKKVESSEFEAEQKKTTSPSVIATKCCVFMDSHSSGSSGETDLGKPTVTKGQGQLRSPG